MIVRPLLCLALLAPALLGLATPALAAPEPMPPESRWPTLPRLAIKPDFKASTDWIAIAQQLETEKSCTFPSKRPGWTTVEIPFAVRLDAKGRVQQVAVGDTGCAALEEYLSGIIAKWGPKQITPPTGAGPYWRSSRVVAGWEK